MEPISPLKQRLKVMLVENLMLQLAPEQIGDEDKLFGPDSLGLDSVDALQLVVALDKNFGLKVPDPATAREVLQNINSMAAAIERRNGG